MPPKMVEWQPAKNCRDSRLYGVLSLRILAIVLYSSTATICAQWIEPSNQTNRTACESHSTGSTRAILWCLQNFYPQTRSKCEPLKSVFNIELIPINSKEKPSCSTLEDLVFRAMQSPYIFFAIERDRFKNPIDQTNKVDKKKLALIWFCTHGIRICLGLTKLHSMNSS